MSAIRDHLRRLRSAPAAEPAPVAKPATQPSTGPKTKPRPKTKPSPKPAPAQPVAATTETKPKLPYCGAQLPVVALTAADVPPGAKVVLGTLLRDADPHHGRPLVMLRTECTCSKREHHYPWRSDWPVDVSVRSHQKSRCRKHKGPDGVWLAIDPGRVEQSLQVVREMREALVAWKAAKTSKRTPTPQETANV